MKVQGIKLDERDIKILSILQREGRITKAALASRVNLSPTPCWERLKRLERAGVIEGYGVRLTPEIFGKSTLFFMEAELESHQARAFELFENAIQTLDEVLECWAVGGGIDYILKISVCNVDEYQLFVDRLLGDDIGLKRYFTYVVTKPIKSQTTNLLPDNFAP